MITKDEMKAAEAGCNAMRKYNALSNDLDARYNRGRISWEDYIAMQKRARREFTDAYELAQ